MKYKTKLTILISSIFFFVQTVNLYCQTAEEFAMMASEKMEEADYEEAIEDFSNAIRLQPDYDILYRAYFGRAFCKFQLGDYEGAKNDLDRSIREFANDPEVFFWRAYTKYKLRYPASSEIADYNRAILLNPNYAEAYFNRGQAKIKNRQLRAACTDLRKAYELGYEEAKPHIRIHCGKP